MASAPVSAQRPLREIPNSQVLDAADAYRAAYHLMQQQDPGSGVLLPELHCAFTAIELYLKAMSAFECEVPDTLGGGGAIIYAKAAAAHHILEKLFDAAPADARSRMEDLRCASARLAKYATVRDAFSGHDQLFMDSRYPYEVGRDFTGITMEALHELVELASTAARTIQHRWQP